MTTTSLAFEREPEVVFLGISTCLLPPPPPLRSNVSQRWFFSFTTTSLTSTRESDVLFWFFQHASQHHHLLYFVRKHTSHHHYFSRNCYYRLPPNCSHCTPTAIRHAVPFPTTCLVTSGVPGDPFVVCHVRLCHLPLLPLY